jgi:RNA polymerase sigma factor (sigma-70 family)
LSSTSPCILPEKLRVLMIRVAGGDAEAFRQIHLETSSRLYAHAFNILRKHELAEDVLQETFIAIWRSAIGYQSHLSAPVTWMTTILRNKAFDLLRTIDYAMDVDALNFDEKFIDSVPDPSPTPIQIFELNRRKVALAKCMAQLNSPHREVIYMSFFDDLSHSEIAIQLDIPIGTVKTWIRRSLSRLGTSLNKLEGKR